MTSLVQDAMNGHGPVIVRVIQHVMTSPETVSAFKKMRNWLTHIRELKQAIHGLIQCQFIAPGTVPSPVPDAFTKHIEVILFRALTDKQISRGWGQR
jgi:hypothetical protein